MNNLFPRAIGTAMSCIKSWLPDGREEGCEWVARNPTRNDSEPGSFKINLSSGKWSDFATGDAGNDPVSLYAYLHHDRFSTEASISGFKNIDGGIQTLAAKEILERFDPNYFPGEDDVFEAPKQQGDRWAGFSFMSKGVDNPPELDTEWAESKFGKVEKIWNFKRYVTKGNLRVVMKVVRFRSSDGKKEDRPFTIWKNGSDIKWRMKRGFEKGKIPLYNEYLLEDRPNDEFGLFEGQKCGAAAEDSQIKDFYVPIAFYGGAGNAKDTDWSPLVGRSGFFWPDGDGVGRKVIVMLKELEMKIRVVHTPSGKPKGWDVADCIDEGIDPLEIIEGEQEDRQDDFIDDGGFPFRIVGTTNKSIYIYTHESCEVYDVKKMSLAKGHLIALMSRDDWGAYFAKPDGGVAWETAINFILREAARKPIFDSRMVRGTGCWIDEDRVIVNTGREILCEGKTYKLYEFPSKYVYEKSARMPYSYQNPNKENGQLLKVCRAISWQNDASAEILAGWLLLAPFGGCLAWRPHAWIHGLKGSGKSWIMNEIVAQVLKGFSINMLGSSTPAGTRQKIKNSSRAICVDEMEKANKRMEESVDDKLMMARMSSTGGENQAEMLQGTADGDGKGYQYMSMWLAASIGIGTVDGADKDRWTALGLKNPKKVINAEAKFLELQKEVEKLTDFWCNGAHARTFIMMSEILEAIETFKNCATKILGVKRHGDQYGTLFAGAYMAVNDKAPTAAEATAYLNKFDLKDMFSDADADGDEQVLLDEILSQKVEVVDKYNRNKFAIGSLIKYLHDDSPDDEIGFEAVKKALGEVGINYCTKGNEPFVQIADKHPGMRDLLKDTQWKNNYLDILGQLDFFGPKSSGPTRFGGVNKRYRKAGVAELLGDCEVLF